MTVPVRRSIGGRPAGRVALVFLLVGLVGLAGGCTGATERSVEPAAKVLVISLPGVTWAELERNDLPHLEALVHRSAVADLSTRIGRGPASSTAAYLTLGAGTRAVVPGIDGGVALNPDELHGGVPAAEILKRRLGATPSGIAYIPVGATLDANAHSAYGAEPGLLGDLLAAHDVRRAVIANADAAEGFPTDEPPPDGAYARSAATALMGSDGIVPAGSVGRGLLTDDADAPFGRRYDQAAVLSAFDAAWTPAGPAVVLVEASDLSRAAAYAGRTTPAQGAHLRAEALASTDALVGELLDRIGPDDAVLALSPTARSGLGMVSLRAPGIRSGLLQTASTRRAGYVYLADVAPTILQLVGIDAPDGMEGRPFTVSSSTGNRIDRLRHQAADAATRDARLPTVVEVVIGLLVVLVGLTWWDERRGSSATARRRLGATAVVLLGLVPGTFLAGLVPATRSSDLAYGAVVGAVAALVGLVGARADRRRPGTGGLVGVGAILLVIGTDVLVGAPLQVNSVFGYSMAVAGRFTGIGNLAFALFGAAGICAVVLLHDRDGDRSLRLGAVLLAAVAAVEGLPVLGADVGGVLSMVPAFLLTLRALRGRPIRGRDVAGALAAGLATVVAFGVIDSALPASWQTHLARLGGHLVGGRFGTVDDILLRRLRASFGAGDQLTWTLVIGLVVVAALQAALVALRRVGPDRPGPARPPAVVALWVGLGTLAGLGLVANDSSVAVPATMLIVIVPVLVLRRLRDRGAAGAPAGDAVEAPAHPIPAGDLVVAEPSR